MASACDIPSAAGRQRFVIATMSDGTVMKVPVSEEVLSPARGGLEEAAQVTCLKTLRNAVRAIFNAKYDDVALNILGYVINNEPVSIYRVAKTVPYTFSLTYKKANRLIHEGLVRQVPAGEVKDRRCRRLVESTVKGLLTSWNLGYMDDRELLESLGRKWGVDAGHFPKLDRLFKVLPAVASEEDTAVFQDLWVLAAAVAAYEDNRLAQEDALRPDEGPQDGRCASRYVLAQALKKVCKGSTVVFASEDYAISYEPGLGRTYIYSCALCDKGCAMTEVSPRFPKCEILNDLLTSFSLRAAPQT